MAIKLRGIAVLSTKYTDVSANDWSNFFAKSRILTSRKDAYTRRAMAAIEKPRGLKRKLDLEEDEEQDTGEDQQMQDWFGIIPSNGIGTIRFCTRPM